MAIRNRQSSNTTTTPEMSKTIKSPNRSKRIFARVTAVALLSLGSVAVNPADKDASQALAEDDYALDHQYDGAYETVDYTAESFAVPIEFASGTPDDPRGYPVNSGETICVNTTARSGDVVFGNGTVNRTTGAGFATIHTPGANPEATSNNNFVAEQTIPNAFSVVAGPNGRVCYTPKILGDGSTHLILDATGYINGEVFTPIDRRLINTRTLPADSRTLELLYDAIVGDPRAVLYPGQIGFSCEYRTLGPGLYQRTDKLRISGLDPDPNPMGGPFEDSSMVIVGLFDYEEFQEKAKTSEIKVNLTRSPTTSLVSAAQAAGYLSLLHGTAFRINGTAGMHIKVNPTQCNEVS